LRQPIAVIRRAACYAVLAIVFNVNVHAQPAATSVIEVPAELLHDGTFHATARGLTPGDSYVFRGELVSRAGTIWRSNATFVADDRGAIDTAVAKPLSGTYGDADSIGLLWSMEKTADRSTDSSLSENDDRTVVTFKLYSGDKTLAEKQTTLWYRAPGISQTELRTPVIGAFFAPYNAKKLPAVIILGGSEGGTPRADAALVASHGFATLALAYFGVDGLPDELDRLPVETVTKAVVWLRSQPSVDRNRIAIMGASKGAELGLFAATHLPEIRALVATAPSSVVYQSIRRDHAQTPSWTIDGKDVPFASFVSSDDFTKSHQLVALYRAALAAAPPETEIRIENIRGPVLLIAGKKDELWPSAAMTDALVARGKRMHMKFAVESRQFDDSGHHTARIPLRPVGDSVRLGGSAAGIAHAQVESWKTIVSFLERTLKN
jgi:dienelactone hydrolase